MSTSIGGTEIIFGDVRQPRSLPLSHPKARWQGFKSERITLPKGYQRRKGCLSLPCSIIFERDMPVKLRDGVTIYVDIYRPSDESTEYPAILAWSPYGKQGGQGNQVLDDFPFRMGVPLKDLSELQKWEGPDPAYWVNHGYAIINVDSRGAGKSEGNIYQFGSQEGRDGADVVDWVGTRPWCSGKVALSGNSYLAISQWFIAAERPKHLAAIAPWEGISDLFRDGVAAGGVLTKPALTFNLQLLQVNAGEGSWENTVAMAIRHKVHTEYHEDKRAKVELIDVPAYVVASWSNPIHTFGTFRAYMQLKSDKWLRIHDTWEWTDYYKEANISDLSRFFDHYLKGIDNGWTQTPRVRAKILDTAIPSAARGMDIELSAFPAPATKFWRLWLDGHDGTLKETRPQLSRQDIHIARDISFNYVFTRDTVLFGPLQVHLSVSTVTGVGCDLFLRCCKLSPRGNRYSQLQIPFKRLWQRTALRLAHSLGVQEVGALFYEGPRGQVRISGQSPDPEFSKPGFPVHNTDRLKSPSPGEVLSVQVGMTPIGMRFKAGEQLSVTLSMTDTSIFPPVDQATLTVEDFENCNSNAELVLHCGAHNVENESHIIIPVVVEA